jgi:hypothetical protein
MAEQLDGLAFFHEIDNLRGLFPELGERKTLHGIASCGTTLAHAKVDDEQSKFLKMKACDASPHRPNLSRFTFCVCAFEGRRMCLNVPHSVAIVHFLTAFWTLIITKVRNCVSLTFETSGSVATNFSNLSASAGRTRCDLKHCHAHFYKALFDEIKKFGRSQKMMGIGARPQPILRPYFLSSGFTYFTVPPPFCECR